ncbi:MAG: helix-hairpin-helix domain-containing protein [Lunatimonas sp.]|uniref:ComEA family DNA-binding protein n=1 Tax=Lunatimonas sp. TaxID=2060141 RepID=UPI00263BE4D1|nr:helix-hairpin-helix domain-containing protein [Lunatimonas sp.]MCC5936256.1 helix-hairpin-helix domain-containing protein [Lunatimonas sp.]
MRRVLLGMGWLLLILPCSPKGYTQQVFRPEIDMEAFVEELFAMQEDDMDYEDLYENLLQLYLNPISLNRTYAEELSSLFILSPLQIARFLEYREQVGPLVSLYELQTIPDWDLETVQKMLPFVTLDQSGVSRGGPLWQRIKSERDAYLIVRHRRVWETRRGFTPPDTLSGGRLSTRYLGDPNDLYLRFRVQHAKDFSLGFTADKDAGESFVWDPNTKRYGFNFLSYHFTRYQWGRWKTLTFGDYQLQFGQGLVFGAGFGVGKGAETITTVRRSSLGVRPYTSALEFGFFRGAAATYQTGLWEWTVMVGDTPRDARLQIQTDSLDMETGFFSSLLRSGLHRTPSEIAAKAQGRERNLGGNVQYRSLDRNFQWGVNALHTSYSQPFLPNPRIYNSFEFRGRENHVHSTYFSYNYQNYFFFGETALSKSGGTGSVLGLMASLSSKMDASFLWRKYERHFHSFYGNAFAEGSRPINESGMYLGLQYRPSRLWSWSFYYDAFRFPWMRFRVYAPSSGHEWLTRVSFRPDRNTQVFLQWREEVKDRNLLSGDQEENHYRLMAGTKRNGVVSLDRQFSRVWGMKSRVQFSTFDFAGRKTNGFVVMQDIQASWERFSLSGRFALFDTDDFDNRQYVYEKNVLWAFSAPNYFGQGMRYYLLGQCRINRQLTVWGRWARTAYTDRSRIGTGLQEIDGNTLSETTLQLRYQFNR